MPCCRDTVLCAMCWCHSRILERERHFLTVLCCCVDVCSNYSTVSCSVPYAAAVPCAVCVVIGVVVVSWSRKMPVSVNGISSSSSKSWRWPHCFYRPCYRQLSHVADCDIACQILRAYLFFVIWGLIILTYIASYSSVCLQLFLVVVFNLQCFLVCVWTVCVI